MYEYSINVPVYRWTTWYPYTDSYSIGACELWVHNNILFVANSWRQGAQEEFLSHINNIVNITFVEDNKYPISSEYWQCVFHTSPPRPAPPRTDSGRYRFTGIYQIDYRAGEHNSLRLPGMSKVEGHKLAAGHGMSKKVLRKFLFPQFRLKHLFLAWACPKSYKAQ